MRQNLILLIFLCILKVVNSQNLPLYNITDPLLEKNDFLVGVYIDSTNTLNIDNLSKLHTQFELTTSRYAIKSVKKTYWFVFELKNTLSHKVEKVIGFDEVFLETVDIYYKSDSTWVSKRNGLSMPMVKKEVKNQCPYFNITLNPNEKKTIYLRAYSEFALIIGITIKDKGIFLKQEHKKTIWYWAYFGAAIAILMYNLFLLLYIREKVYLFYVIYAICFIVFAFTYSGYVQYLTSNVKIIYGLNSSIALMGAFITLFTRELLKTKQHTIWIDKTLLFISLIYVIIALLVIADIYFYQWLVAFGSPSMFFLLFTGIYSLIKKVEFSGFYLIAMSSYLIGLIMIVAVNQGLIPYNTFTRYGFMMGSLVELILFSFALGYRIKHLQDEKNSFQERLLITEKDQNKKLEIQIKKRTEELTIMNNKLYKLSKFKEDMTGMIIHDLKNPLNTIINAQNIKDKNTKTFTIEQSSKNMLNLVQNILDIYKSEHTQIKLNKTSLSLVQIITNTVNTVQYLVKQKSLKIKVNQTTNCTVKADKDIIERVFVNLFINAIKASPNNEIIHITIKCNKSVVKVSISNKGKGIPLNQQKVIFEKYKQLENTPNKRNSWGLGLTFSKLAIEAHKGKIGVISKSSIGATFWFTLPNVECVKIDNVLIENNSRGLEMLSKADKDYLVCFVQELKKHKTFDIWEINNILEKIEPKSNGVSEWLLELEDAIYSGNNKRFEKLLKF